MRRVRAMRWKWCEARESSKPPTSKLQRNSKLKSYWKDGRLLQRCITHPDSHTTGTELLGIAIPFGNCVTRHLSVINQSTKL